MSYAYSKYESFLKQLGNLVVAGVILFIASRIFPEVIRIDSLETLTIIVFLLFVVETVVTLLAALITVLGYLALEWVAFVIGFLGLLFGEILALYLLSLWIIGFEVVGFLPKLLLALTLTVARLPDKLGNND